jgi:hypothetical protein
MQKPLFFLLILLLLVFPGWEALAQCAMCKATIEANSANSSKYGVGLNTGILYLMCIPYIAGAVLGYLWYKNAKLKGKLPRFGKSGA